MSIFSIGVTGLDAAMIGLSTTSHNIANASTTGYNRQTIVQGTNFATLTGAGYIGQGTNVETVKRIYDQFLSQEVMSAQTSAAEMNSYSAQISQIDNLLGNTTSGLSVGLANFFSGVQQVAADPTSIAARQTMLSDANALVSTLQTMDQRLSQIRTGVNSQITSEVSAINSYSKQIADLNQRINLASAGSGSNQQPNDLLDKRDQVIAELNQHIRVSTLTQADGTVSVFFGNGEPLVVGNTSYTLSTQPASDDPNRTVVAVQAASGGAATEVSESQLTGGTLGGLVSFRSQSLDSAQNALGRMAIAIGQNFNDQSKLGQDLNGLAGTDIFNLGSPATIASSQNTGSAALTATLTSTAASDLTTSDYQLGYDGTNYVLTRLSDGKSWSAASVAAVATSAGQGFDLAIASGAINAGDVFKIEPTRMGSAGMSVAITDPRSIAAAAPFRTAAALDNIGTAKISAGSVDTPPPPNANLQQPVMIAFIDPTHFSVTGTGIPASASLPPYVSYTSGADVSYNGWTVQITGAAVAGDTFTVAANTGGTADSRNAVALAALQTKSTMIGGTASYQEAYAQLVSEVGNKASEVSSMATSQQAAADQADSARKSVSGVNLDEEAANLIKYQQAYQASAKVISIASKLFDQILALGQ
jgi:flagellar hook-associated protein 1 FlgK